MRRKPRRGPLSSATPPGDGEPPDDGDDGAEAPPKGAAEASPKEGATPDPPKDTFVNGDTVRADVVRSESAQLDAVHADALRTEARMDSVRPDAVRVAHSSSTDLTSRDGRDHTLLGIGANDPEGTSRVDTLLGVAPPHADTSHNTLLGVAPPRRADASHRTLIGVAPPAPSPDSHETSLSVGNTKRDSGRAAADVQSDATSGAAVTRTAAEGATPTKSAATTASDEFDEPPSRPEKTPSRRRVILRRVIKVTLGVLAALLIAGVLGVYFTVRHYSADLPSVASLKQGYEPPQITRIFARDQTLLGSIFKERRTVIPFDQVPDSAKLAFLAAEDAHFYEHEGINYFGLMRALYANVRAGRMVQGGSTITQQVIKNVLLDSERSMRRKVREVLLVHRLEHSLTKDEIFWLYLNHIYLGHGRYGIEEAARFYFGKPAKELALEEAATLAGLVASPENYSPRRDPEKSLKRRTFVLDQMLKKGFVTPELFESTNTAPLRLAPAEEAESRLAPEMMDHARTLLQRTLPQDSTSGGFQVTTTLDPALQASARQAVRNAIDAYMKRHALLPPYTATSRKLWPIPFVGTPKPFRIYTGVVESSDDKKGTIDVRVGDTLGQVSLMSEGRYNPGHLKPSEFAKPGAALRVSITEVPPASGKAPLRLELGPQGALVALDIRSREVVAMVGGYEAVLGGLDRSTQTRRQPGSAFKPILFSYALHARRVTPATVIEVKTRKQGVPKEGPATIGLRDAVAHSNNEAAEAVMRMVGPKGVVDWAQALGIESRLGADLSLALGSYEVTLLELTNAYAAFANGGNAGEPLFVSKAMTPKRAELVLPARAPERTVLSADEAYLTTSLMESVVRYGTARAAQSLGRDAAGKTGTTNEAKDAWFVGYTTDIVAGVWVGYDDALPLGSGESGAKTALPAWLEFMKAAHEGKPKTTFAKTPGILSVSIDPATGLLPWPGQTDMRNEEFLAGTEPTEAAVAPTATTADAAAVPPAPATAEPPASEVPVIEEPPPF